MEYNVIDVFYKIIIALVNLKTEQTSSKSIKANYQLTFLPKNNHQISVFLPTNNLFLIKQSNLGTHLGRLSPKDCTILRKKLLFLDSLRRNKHKMD